MTLQLVLNVWHSTSQCHHRSVALGLFTPRFSLALSNMGHFWSLGFLLKHYGKHVFRSITIFKKSVENLCILFHNTVVVLKVED